LLLSLNHFVAAILLLFYGVYVHKKDKLISLFSLSIIFIILVNFIFLESTVKEDELNEVQGTIIEIKETEKYNKVTIKSSNYKKIIYDYDFHELKVGYIIYVQGEVLESNENRVEKGFNFKDYLRHQKITSTLQSENIYIVKKNINIGIIRSYFIGYLENNFSDESLVFLKAIIIGDDDGFREEFKDAIVDNGIMHLFAISGLHIGLLVMMVFKVLDFFNMKEKKIEHVTCLFLVLYMVITNFAPSVLRASLMYFLVIINKRLRLGFSSLDIISIIFILLIMVNPYFMYHLGFILSFTAASMITLISPLLKNSSNIKQIFLISFFAVVVTFPIVININNKINILSPITNVLYIYLVAVVILPISVIVLCFPILDGIYKYLIICFNEITIFIANNFKISIIIPDLSFFLIVIYYLLLYIIIKFFFIKKLRYALISFLICLILLLSNINSFKYYGEVDFLDLYNGESIIIRDKYNECTAVIDTGDGTNLEVTTFLKNKGIKKLDYLILTHNHFDHNGEALNIINELDVNKIVFSAYDNSGLADNLSSLKVKANDKIKCGNIYLNILHPDREYENENDNSIVIYSQIGHLNFLFLGDVSQNVEDKIASLNLDVDVVKIGHHGSSTSTSRNFISKIKPRYAIIQTGRIKKFGFPNHQTIATLEYYNITVYRTDINYSIKYKYSKNQSIFKTIK